MYTVCHYPEALPSFGVQCQYLGSGPWFRSVLVFTDVTTRRKGIRVWSTTAIGSTTHGLKGTLCFGEPCRKMYGPRVPVLPCRLLVCAPTGRSRSTSLAMALVYVAKVPQLTTRSSLLQIGPCCFQDCTCPSFYVVLPRALR